MIAKLLKQLPYKLVSESHSYYLNITKCYENYRVMYWNFEEGILIKQFGTLPNALRKTIEAIKVLKEIGKI